MTKLIIALALSVLLLIFVLQNSHPVELHFLFWQFNGSLALILFLTIILSLIISLLVAIPYSIKKRRSKTEVPNAKTPETSKPKS